MWILNRNTGKKIKWEAWDYQLKLLDFFLEYPELVIDKARQVGLTWLVCGYVVWMTLFGGAVNILLMSGNETKAWDLLFKCKYIWENLPDFLKLPLEHDSKGWLVFEKTDAQIKALASTERAGAGIDATLVVRDELREQEYGHQNFVAISPCIDGGGQLIDISTYDKYTPLDQNHFAQRVAKAMKGATKQEVQPYFEFYDGVEHAKLIFLGWKLRPTRKEGMSLGEWYDLEIIPKYSEQDREQEYPLTLEESLRPPITTSFFDVHASNDMLLQVCEPLEGIQEINTYNGMVKIYKKPLTGRRYVIFTDPSDGIVDPFASVVVDDATGEWVAVAHGKLKADQAGKVHDSLVRYYNDAYNSGEGNASSGGKFTQTLEQLKTPNIALRRDTRGNLIKDKGGVPIKGWVTTPEHRKMMLNDYEEAVRQRTITIHYRPAIDELRYFIRDDSGKLRASTGHDDFVMAGAGANAIRKYAPTVTGIKIRTFMPDKRGHYGNS